MAYAADGGDKVYYEIAAPEREAEGRNRGSGSAKHEVTVFDGRDRSQPASLDVHGFELQRDRLPGIDFLDEDCVKRLYYPAMADLAQRRTGAARIHIFDHTVRHGSAGRARGQRPQAAGKGRA